MYFLFVFVGGVALTTGFTNAGSNVPIFFNNYRCGGGERRLIDCARGPNTCAGHTNDAGVRCMGGKQKIMRPRQII